MPITNLLLYNRTFRRILFAVILFLFVLLLTGCATDASGEGSTPIVMFPTRIPPGTLLPTYSFDTPSAPGGATLPPRATNVIPTTRPPTQIPPTIVPTIDANWTPIANGIDYRRLFLTNANGQGAGLLVTRLDPAKVTFKVKYNPGQSKSIQDWLLALPGAIAIVNANFYDQSSNPIGLVSTDSNLFGRSSGRNDGGLFQVRGNAVKVRSLYLEPYNNTERFDQVIEGFPMLMVQGQVAPAFDRTLINTPDRRTVIAQDVHGRILIIVTSPGVASFSDMAKWLGVSGLEVDTALCLDGGSSTSMYLATGGPSAVTPGFKPVPVVLAVYSR
ncbi:MAG: phosphodiester glycosidase family protein [Chloroflexota bacterium]